MNRRTFIQAAAGIGVSPAGALGIADTDQPVVALLRLLEDSPRERLPRELAKRIHKGLRYEDLLAALSVAAVRNVQPYPDVGYKYHSVMVLRSIDSTTQHLSAADKWLPIAWATDYFKQTQAEERATSGWRLPTRHGAAVSTPEAARRSLVTALDHWDRDAADAALVNYLPVASPGEIFRVLFPYGARDLRAIGHKAITVCNAHSLIAFLGDAHAVPILRSTVAALENSDASPNPASHDLEPDRPWRLSQKRLGAIPPFSRLGLDDSGARTEFREALYKVSAEDAGAVVVDLLRRGVSPDAIWQVLFGTAAELYMCEPSILSLHAQTTANALHYAYRVCGNERVQQLMLLQCAAFIAMFRSLTGATQRGFSLEALEPLALHRRGVDAIEEIYSEVTAGDRLQAAGKTLGYLDSGGDAEALIAKTRQYLVQNAAEPHDYKFAEAMIDNYSHLADSAGRRRFLSTGVAECKAAAERPSPVVNEMRELLRL
jgi:hypothetical protein